MADPFSFGRVNPSNVTTFEPGQLVPRWLAGLPIHSSWSAERAMREGYRASSMVYIGTEFLSIGVSMLPFEEQEADPVSGKWVRTKDQSRAGVLHHFNKRMSRTFAMHRATQHLCLTGNSLFLKFAGSLTGRVRELHQANPGGVKPVPDQAMGVSHYRYYRDGAEKFWEADSVIHTMLPNPEDEYWGMPILRPVSPVVDADVKAVAHNRMLLDRRGIPDLLFIDKTITGQDDFDQKDAWLAEQMERKRGREPWLMSGEIDVKEMSQKLADLDYIEGRKRNGLEIGLAFRMLPALTSPDAQTYDNLTTAIRHLYMFGCIPIAGYFADAFTRGLIPDTEWATRRIWFDLSGVAALRADLAQYSEILQRLMQNGTPYNNAIALLQMQLPPIPGGDIPMVSSGYQTLASAQDENANGPL